MTFLRFEKLGRNSTIARNTEKHYTCDICKKEFFRKVLNENKMLQSSNIYILFCEHHCAHCWRNLILSSIEHKNKLGRTATKSDLSKITERTIMHSLCNTNRINMGENNGAKQKEYIEKRKQYWKNEEIRRKYCAGMKKHWDEHPDRVIACSKRSKENWSNENYAKNVANKIKLSKTPEKIKQQSDRMRKLWSSGRMDHVGGGYAKRTEHISWEGNKYFLQGSYEVKFAKWLDENKISYIAQPKRFSYIDNNNHKRTYKPDFYIKNANVFVEIKSWYWLSQQGDKMQRVMENNPQETFLIFTELELRDIGIMHLKEDYVPALFKHTVATKMPDGEFP